MRNLIVCCDGTWNSADQEHDGVPTPTNVFRLFSATPEDEVTRADGTKIVQRKYYHSGVGTEGTKLDRVLGGGVGVGLSKNIMSAYRWLGGNYQEGDQIFLFGFSRGSFTGRSLGGMISHCGLLDLTNLSEKDAWERVNAAYDNGYRNKAKYPKQSTWASDWPFHGTGDGEKKIRIHFVGVWDTVGALGIPNDLALLNLLDDPQKYSFHDTSLSTSIDCARHAIALDEKRASFTPTLWTNIPAGSDVKQVWFPGVHSDVGGGYPEIGLSNGALLWMMDEAAAQGLVLDDKMRKQIEADPLDVMHDSDTGVFALLQSQPRSVPEIDQDSFKAGLLHQSVMDRQKNPPIAQSPYRPSTTLVAGAPETVRTIYSINPWNYTGIYLEAGGTYEFTATGEWMDRSIVCGPGGTNDGNFEPGEIFQVIGTLIGKLEKVYGHVTGNKAVDFKGTRRFEQYPWFSLVGTVANNDGEPGLDGTPAPHQCFLIGNKCRLKNLKKSGYLYCFANDAWNFYGNNRGSVQLAIRRV
jgi:uncharacterized protein (DUF2235 family)